MLHATKEQPHTGAVFFGSADVFPLAADPASPKHASIYDCGASRKLASGVFGEKSLHCFSATAPLSGNSCWGWENSNGKNAAGSALDANGNTTSKTDSTGTTNYTWDFENRLISVTLPGSGGSVSYKYDPAGRRIFKSSSGATSIFAYDGNNLIETANGSGGVVARYIQGLNTDEPFAMLRGTTTDYYEEDGLGSVTSLTDTTGALAETYTYDSFGNTVATTGTLRNYFQYTGREFETETSLYFYRARYYDPQAGRFISEDPIGFNGGNNFYAYALDSPMNWKDPSGLDVTVFLYPGAAGNGHVGIAVNNNPSVGFYPLTDLPTNVLYGPGIVKPDTRTPITSITILTTPDQDKAIQNYIVKHGGFNNGNYSLLSSNCARFVEHALGAGGLPSSNTIYPKQLLDDLENIYNPPPQVPLNVQRWLDNPGLMP